MTAILLCGCFLCACASVEDPSVRRAAADLLAMQAGWQPWRLDGGPFVLSAYVPAQPAAETIPVLTIYIEGDGFAWLTPTQPSADPSPRDPLTLRLALRHPDDAVAWLGRPCQFTADADRRGCGTTYWTERRFSEEVIVATDNAIAQLKRRRHAQRLVLIGYSGGGAVAALVAARRSDVVRLISIAGNLDHREWTRLHAVAPLTGSLNPADFAVALANIPQTHWVGGRDTVIDRRIADSFAARLPAHSPPYPAPQICVLAEADHRHGWFEHWPALLLGSDDCKVTLVKP